MRDAGVPQQEAEAHAEAAREFIMAELVTRADLEVAMAGVHHEITGMQREMASMRRELEGVIERNSLKMMVSLGGMIAVGIAILAAIMKL